MPGIADDNRVEGPSRGGIRALDDIRIAQVLQCATSAFAHATARQADIGGFFKD